MTKLRMSNEKYLIQRPKKQESRAMTAKERQQPISYEEATTVDELSAGVKYYTLPKAKTTWS